jgi:hypothetical protein
MCRLETLTSDEAPDRTTPESLQLGGRASVDHGEDDAPDDEQESAFSQLSQEELRQLEERARARFADPDYVRRIRATDRLARTLLQKRAR